MEGFVDVHSHAVPSGDDGARSTEEAVELCGLALAGGTRVLFATPHAHAAWDRYPLTLERERLFGEAFPVVSRVVSGKVSSVREWLEYVGRDHIHHKLADVGLSRRQAVFFQDDDRRLYLTLLQAQAQRYGLEVWAYCLMTNHVHLVVMPRRAESLTRAIAETHRRYTRAVNFREG